MKTKRNRPQVVQLSPRGQITVPLNLRQSLGLGPGDTLRIRQQDGVLVLEPAAVVPVEVYDPTRIQEFETSSHLTREELESARKAWGL